MTTLITIPGATAYHLPAPGVEPVPLAEGDISLTLVPAFPPTRPNDAVTLTVGSSTFVLTKNAPVQRTNSKNEHPSFVFTPAPLADGRTIGQVRIDMRDSRNQDDWETIESACTALQSELKVRGLWEDKMLFVDDEYETGKVDTAPKLGWGETIASNFMWAASKIMGREPEPTLPTSVPVSSPGVHSTLGPAPPPKPQSPPAPQAVPAQRAEPENFRALASHSWKQAGIAAQGIGAAAAAVGGAIGHQVRDAVDNLGPSPDVPAKDEPSSSAPVPPAKPAPEVVPKEDKPVKVETAKEVPAPEVKTAPAETAAGKKETAAGAEDKAVEDVSASVAAVKLDDKTDEAKAAITDMKTDKPEEAVVVPETTEAAEKTEDAAATPADDDEDTTEANTPEATETEGAAEGAAAPAAKKKNKKKGKKGKN